MKRFTGFVLGCLLTAALQAAHTYSTMNGGAASVKDTWGRSTARFRLTATPPTYVNPNCNPVRRSAAFPDVGTVRLKTVEMVGRRGEGDWKPNTEARLLLDGHEVARSVSFEANTQVKKTIRLKDGKSVSHVGYTFTFDAPRVDVNRIYTLAFYDKSNGTSYNLGHSLVDVTEAEADKHQDSNTAALTVTVEPDVTDLSGRTDLQTVIASGTETAAQCHPTSVRTPDGLLAVWTEGHGGQFSRASFAPDAYAGKRWIPLSPLEGQLKARNHRNCPSVYAMTDPKDGKTRLWIFSQYRAPAGESKAWMPRWVSEDWGNTWTEAEPLGDAFKCVMAFASMVRLNNGAYLGVWHRNADTNGTDTAPRSVYGAVSRDGGQTWEKPRLLVEGRPGKGQDYCEPCVFRSPTDPEELCMLLREQSHDAHSKVVYSRDEGKTWSEPVATSAMLTGERHACLVLPDGRLAIVFRNMELNSRYHGTDFGHVSLWVGTYGELKSGKECGRIFRLLTHVADNGCREADCGYSGITPAPNGDIEVVTYGHLKSGPEKQSVVCVRVPRSVYMQETGTVLWNRFDTQNTAPVVRDGALLSDVSVDYGDAVAGEAASPGLTDKTQATVLQTGNGRAPALTLTQPHAPGNAPLTLLATVKLPETFENGAPIVTVEGENEAALQQVTLQESGTEGTRLAIGDSVCSLPEAILGRTATLALRFDGSQTQVALLPTHRLDQVKVPLAWQDFSDRTLPACSQVKAVRFGNGYTLYGAQLIAGNVSDRELAVRSADDIVLTYNNDNSGNGTGEKDGLRGCTYALSSLTAPAEAVCSKERHKAHPEKGNGTWTMMCSGAKNEGEPFTYPGRVLRFARPGKPQAAKCGRLELFGLIVEPGATGNGLKVTGNNRSTYFGDMSESGKLPASLAVHEDFVIDRRNPTEFAGPVRLTVAPGKKLDIQNGAAKVSGELLLQGGGTLQTANGLSVAAGGCLTLRDGSSVTGKLTLEGSELMLADAGVYDLSDVSGTGCVMAPCGATLKTAGDWNCNAIRPDAAVRLAADGTLTAHPGGVLTLAKLPATLDCTTALAQSGSTVTLILAKDMQMPDAATALERLKSVLTLPEQGKNVIQTTETDAAGQVRVYLCHEADTFRWAGAAEGRWTAAEGAEAVWTNGQTYVSGSDTYFDKAPPATDVTVTAEGILEPGYMMVGNGRFVFAGETGAAIAPSAKLTVGARGEAIFRVPLGTTDAGKAVCASPVDGEGILTIASGVPQQMTADSPDEPHWVVGDGQVAQELFLPAHRGRRRVTVNEGSVLVLHRDAPDESDSNRYNARFEEQWDFGGPGTLRLDGTAAFHFPTPDRIERVRAESLSLDNRCSAVFFDVSKWDGQVMNIGTLSGTGDFSAAYGNGNGLTLRAVQQRSSEYSGIFRDTRVKDKSERLFHLTVAAGAGAENPCLTLSGKNASVGTLTVENRAVLCLNGQWSGPAEIAGTLRGTGTLGGSLTFSEGAVLDASDGALTVKGDVSGTGVAVRGQAASAVLKLSSPEAAARAAACLSAPEGLRAEAQGNDVVLKTATAKPETDIVLSGSPTAVFTPEQKQCVLDAAGAVGIDPGESLKVTLAVAGSEVASPTPEAVTAALSVFDGIAENDSGTLRVSYCFGVSAMKAVPYGDGVRLVMMASVAMQTAAGETRAAAFAANTEVSVQTAAANGDFTETVPSVPLTETEARAYFGDAAVGPGVVCRAVAPPSGRATMLYRVRVTRTE